jgi:hypothetical protein
MGYSAREDERLDVGSGLKLERPRIVQFSHSTPRPPQPESPKVESAPTEEETPEPFITFNLGRISLIIGIGLSITLFVWASGYVIREAYREIGVPEPATTTHTESPVGTPVLLVTADMLHVSSIALGKVRLAVVNGQELIEGDSLKVKTPAGDAMVCATRIKDGIVRFEYRGRTIDAHMSTSLVRKAAAK